MQVGWNNSQANLKCNDFNFKGFCIRQSCPYQHLCMYCHNKKSSNAYIASHHNQPTIVITPLNESNQTILLFISTCTSSLPDPAKHFKSDKGLQYIGVTLVKIEICRIIWIITLIKKLLNCYHLVSYWFSFKLRQFKASSSSQEYEISQGSYLQLSIRK